MEEINKNPNEKKAVIDFGKILKTLLPHKKVYYYTIPIVVVATYLLVCCIPRYYRCSVIIAPENMEGGALGGISSTLSSMGLGSLAKMGNNDAISPELYPELLSSNDFIARMFAIEVTTKDGDITTNYYDHLLNHRKDAFWDLAIGYVTELIDPTPATSFTGKEHVDVFSMSKRQQDIAMLIKGNISCDIDQKTYAINISVEDQDPRVCAMIADSTKAYLQQFIIDYRTCKAKNDYEYYASLCNKAEQEYNEVRREYARFADANSNVNLNAVRLKIEDLENDMQMKYTIYTTMNTQKQAALAKIQESTPAFTTLQSATMPIKPAGPKRMIISLAMGVVAFVGLSIYYLRKSIC